MRKGKLLFVEDEETQRDSTVRALRKLGWEVETAANGCEALEKIQDSASHYSVIILDLLMPKMPGDAVLEHIRDNNLKVPPIIVLSAVAHKHLHKCRYLGASHVLQKPVDPSDLDVIASTVIKGVIPMNTDIDFDDELLDYMVRRREATLRGWLSDAAQATVKLPDVKEPLFVVARRWNSWYPSLLPVHGGGYAVMAQTGRGPTGNQWNAVVIDPGFRSLRIFMELGLPWSDMDTCVISHNHPDHVAGVAELLAARHALGQPTRLFCNNSCLPVFQNNSGFNLQVKALNENNADVLDAYYDGEAWVRVRLAAFDTSHDEIGSQNSSQGLNFTVDRGSNKNALDQSSSLVILGDTEYDRAAHRKRWMPILCKPNVKIVVLHIGSSELKQKTGKHLYLPGIRNILADMESELSTTRFHGQQLVLVSEWGLEHATKQQIAAVCNRPARAFDEYSPIVETIKLLRKGLNKLVILPADIGLTVGMDTGHIYVDGSGIPPTRVQFAPSELGITYNRSPNG